MVGDHAWDMIPVWSPSGDAIAVCRMDDSGPDEATIAFLDLRPNRIAAEGMVPLYWWP
jgi:Tol biopolymer transport system component